MFWQARACSKQGARYVCRLGGRLKSAVNGVLVVTIVIARAKVHAWVQRLELSGNKGMWKNKQLPRDTAVIDYPNISMNHGCQNYRKMSTDFCVGIFVSFCMS